MQERPPKNWTFPVTFDAVNPSRFGARELELRFAHEREAAEKEAAEWLAAERPFPEPDPAPAQAQSAHPPPPPPHELPYELSPDDPPDLARHSRRCAICSHPDRDAIEGDFIRWRSPQRIAKDYGINSRASVYRHAHVLGLFQRRRREVARVLESFMECSEFCPPEAADMIVRATRLYVHLNEHGEWIEPPRTQYIIYGPPPAAAVAGPSPSLAPAPPQPPSDAETQNSNRNTPHFKNSVNT
ncbi:MAG: hypothetical protein WA192_00340 [Candidatus Acidiferrales bacterium]